MSFDKPTRNALAKMVGECRRLLIADIRDQIQRAYGLQPDGTDLPVESLGHLDEGGQQTAVELREWHEHLASTEPGPEAKRRVAAFDRLAHETAFTALNRLAALRLCEERAHVIECVRRGMESDGFKLFERLSGGALGSRSTTYRVFLERMFDELAVDLGVLFDRRAPQSLVFPSESCLERVLEVLNDSNLVHLWQDDETIGWIYQYFNPKEERDAMRKASPTPRDSHELAVRNQFFTPRYVVEFLTDNTLGRIWYEMRQGDTLLTEHCRYLLRRPTEIFLQPEQELPKEQNAREELGPEELLRQPSYVPFRPKKDPRDLKILDPACGSAHFLLYAFNLLEAIYEEAWKDEKSPPSRSSGKTLHEEYPDLVLLCREIPSLIIRHNLHGIEIDPRCCQIAALALWLRAQSTYQRLGLKADERPQITRSNIVCAESMPGETELLEEFVADLKPPFLTQLVRTIFEKMRLAGQAGYLLKIEEEIRGSIAEAKKQWAAGPAPEQLLLLPEAGRRNDEQLGLFDVSGITEEAFWEEAEARVVEAVQKYAGEAINSQRYRRRLFAEDAVEGFAFVDVCRKRFDVVLMNPPFGGYPKTLDAYLARAFPQSKEDLYSAFVEAAENLTITGGRIGALTNRTGLFLATQRAWREQILLNRSRMCALADLGFGVLDALVETAAYVVQIPRGSPSDMICIRLLKDADKEEALRRRVHALWATAQSEVEVSSEIFICRQESFALIPQSRISYWVQAGFRKAFEGLDPIIPKFADGRVGMHTSDNFRFLRLDWEVPPAAIGSTKEDFSTGCKRWARFAKGGEYSLYYGDIHLLVDWNDNGLTLKTWASSVYGDSHWSRLIQGADFYFKEGVTYPRRTASGFSPRILPPGLLFDAQAPCLFPRGGAVRTLALLGILGSRCSATLIDAQVAAGDAVYSGSAARTYELGVVGSVPVPPIKDEDARLIANAVEQVYTLKRNLDSFNETGRFFSPSRLCVAASGVLGVTELRVRENEDACIRSLQLTGKIEKLVASLYGLDSAALREIAVEFGGHPNELPTVGELSADEFRKSYELSIDALIDQEVTNSGGSRALTKKVFFADRRLEILASKFGAHPRSIVAARRRLALITPFELRQTAHTLVSYLVGCVFGRWDVRMAADPTLAPPLAGPFEPIPNCPPAMLVSANNSPASRNNIVSMERLAASHIGGGLSSTVRETPTSISESEYPLKVNWNGILVDDDHQDEIGRRIFEALKLLSSGPAEFVDEELCRIFYEKDVRDYLRKPSGFFADHLRRYSKSRRQAPIYWPLSTASGSYTLWIYYHRLDDDLLYKLVNDYVNPRLAERERRFNQTESALTSAVGHEATKLRTDLEIGQSLIAELQAFKAELLRVAALPYKPNLNDGVLITASPLWKLFRHPKWRKDLAECWKKLEAGEYDWAHLAYSIWPERVQEKCKTDRSLAIAHGLEAFCGVARRGKSSKRSKRASGGATGAQQMDIPEIEILDSDE